MNPSIRSFINDLPKTETHLHLEGALPWELLQAANPGKYPTTPASWEPDFRFHNFEHFESELLGYASDFFTSAQRYHDCARAVFADRRARNIRYMEVSFASGCMDFKNIDGHEVCDAIRAAVPVGLEVRIFFGIHHDGYTQKMAPMLEDALCWTNLDGIDLHGLETIPLGDWTPDYWRRARDAGKFTKAHAGEFCGPDFIRCVVETLGVERIQHGVRAVEDPAVLDFLRNRSIALDLCPISNLKLSVVPSADKYPIRQLLNAGIVCTISTDDPISFGNTIEDEYLLLAEHLALTTDELAQLARNGFLNALASEDLKQSLLSRP